MRAIAQFVALEPICKLVIIRTIEAEETTQSFSMGTLAGAGCFKCEECGFAVALHELDQVPECPHCGETSFRRGSIFTDLGQTAPMDMPELDVPEWLGEAREALRSERVHVLSRGLAVVRRDAPHVAAA